MHSRARRLFSALLGLLTNWSLSNGGSLLNFFDIRILSNRVSFIALKRQVHSFQVQSTLKSLPTRPVLKLVNSFSKQFFAVYEKNSG